MSRRVCSNCTQGQHSRRGSAQCAICDAGYYRPHRDSSVAECAECGEIGGVTCGIDTTIETFYLTEGNWRHSNATATVYPCDLMGSWTPCRGGGDARGDGDGYCENTEDGGYRGLR
eukprot:5707399-Prymnesium_polylepis.1